MSTRLSLLTFVCRSDEQPCSLLGTIVISVGKLQSGDRVGAERRGMLSWLFARYQFHSWAECANKRTTRQAAAFSPTSPMPWSSDGHLALAISVKSRRLPSRRLFY